MTELPIEMKNAMLKIAQALSGRVYAFRGTVSLVLQGLDMNVDDVDVVCNKETALDMGELFSDYLVREVKYSESSKFKSYFGEFNMDGLPAQAGVKVEVMGNWQIKDTKGVWGEIHDGSQRVELILDGQQVYVTPIKEELGVFMEMGRWNAYHKIKRQLPDAKTEKPKEPDPQLSLF